MMSTIGNILHTISDHGNALISKFIVWAGVGGIGYSGAVAVSGKAASDAKLALESTQPYFSFAASDVGIVISIVSGVCLIIKTLVDIYFKIKESKEATLNRRKEDQVKIAEEHHAELRARED